jgi:hypothetical protein
LLAEISASVFDGKRGYQVSRDKLLARLDDPDSTL